MDFKNKVFKSISFLAGEEVVALIKVAPFFEYSDDGKRAAAPSGSRYTCLIREGLQTLDVKIDGAAAISQEEIEAIQPQMFVVGFQDFTAKPYTDSTTKQPQVSAKAGGIYKAGRAELIFKEDKKS